MKMPKSQGPRTNDPMALPNVPRVSRDRLLIGAWSLLGHCVAALCIAFAVNVSAAFVTETSDELFTTGDFDGDGRADLVIVDRQTGDYRLGFQLTGGTFTWVAARASGIPNVTGLSVGKFFNTTRDALAFTAPDANRLNLFDASSLTSNGLPVSVFLGTSVALQQDFEVSTPISYALSQLSAAPGPGVQAAGAGTSGRFLRLITDGVNSQGNAVTFGQTAPGLFQTIIAQFDFRLTSADQPADGFAFMLIPTATYGTNGPGFASSIAFEEPNIAGVFAVAFDVFDFSGPINDVAAHWNGSQMTAVSVATANVNFASGNFHRAQINLTFADGGAYVTVMVTPNVSITPGASGTVAINNFFIAGLNPYDCRVELAARSGALDMSVDLDNVNVQFLAPRTDQTPVGPNLAIGLDIGGAGNTAHDDLFVGTLWNSLPDTFRLLGVRNSSGASFATLNSLSVSAPAARGNAVTIKTATVPKAAMLFRGATSDVFRAYDLSAGTAVQTLLATNLPAGADYLYANFSASPLAQFLFFKPGQSNLLLFQVQEPVANSFQFGPSSSFNLGAVIREVSPLPGSSSTKLLVIFGNGESANVYNFDGTNAPVLLQTFTPEPGELFNGIAALGGNNFMMLSVRNGSRTSTHFRPYNFNGTSYLAGSSGTLPTLNRFTAAANVVLFQYEPFVSPNPVIVQTLNAGDWTSRLALTGAVPRTILVTNESFLSAGSGLGNPGLRVVGKATPPSTFGLVNQYLDPISVFSYAASIGDQVADVKIVPDPGIYPTAIKLSFLTTGPPSQVFYRFGTAGNWKVYTASPPAWIFSNTTVFYYAQTLGGTSKSAIRSAAYQFTTPPDKLDSDGDGVPDYVEIANGLDPVNSGADADGDGFSDFDELIKGSDPLNTGSHPIAKSSAQKGAFDLVATPRPLDGFSNVISLTLTSTAVRAFDLGGSLLAFGTTTNLSISGATNPAVVLSNLVIDPRQRLLAVATEQHFSMITSNADKAIGRELIGLRVMPSFSNSFAAVPYSYGGSNITNEANGWIAAASNAVALAVKPVLLASFTIYDSLVALLLEKKIGDILTSRGETNGTNLTLFSFRPTDAGRASLGLDDLLNLEFRTTNGLPGYLLQPMFRGISNLVFAPPDADVLALRAIASSIYRISSASNNTSPGVYPLPVDSLRQFINLGTLHSNYFSGALLGTDDFSSDQQYHARRGVTNILAAVGSRPTTNILLAIRPDTFAGTCTMLDSVELVPKPKSLFHPGGAAYHLLESFNLVPGSQVQVFGYTDITNTSCAGDDIEVITLSLLSVPAASDSDLDGNLLKDSWELLFNVHDPFADRDGDGYGNLQEMLEGTDPTDPLSHPAVAPMSLAPPKVAIEALPAGQVRLSWTWPSAYASSVRFSLRSTTDLGTPFADVVVTVSNIGDQYEAVFTPALIPGSPGSFYRLSLALTLR